MNASFIPNSEFRINACSEFQIPNSESIRQFIFNFLEKALFGNELDALRFGESFDVFALGFVKALGNIDLKDDDEIAFLIGTELGHAGTFNFDHIARLCTCGHFDFLRAVKRFDFEFAAENGLRHMNMLFDIKVEPFALNGFMRFDGQKNVEVASGCALCPGTAFAAQSKARTVVDAGRNLDSNFPFLRDASLPLACCAWFINFHALAMALWARGLNCKKSLLHLDAAAAVACGALGFL